MVIIAAGLLAYLAWLSVEIVDVSAFLLSSSYAEKAAFFKAGFPSDEAIRRYVDDATFLYSENASRNTQVGNNFYNEVVFIKGQDVTTWQNTEGSGRLAHGQWWLEERTRILLLWNWHVKFTTRHTFCRTSTLLSPTYPFCVRVVALRYLPAIAGRDAQKRRQGDVFGLESATVPPMILPLDKPITYEGLLEEIRSKS